MRKLPFILAILGAAALLLFLLAREELRLESDSTGHIGTRAGEGQEPHAPGSTGLDHRPSDDLGSKGETEREPSRGAGSTLRGRVVSSTGHPIEAARVQLIRWSETDLAWEPAWQATDWGPLVRDRHSARTDAAGRFDLQTVAASSLGSVLWASHPGFVATCLLLPSSPDPASGEMLLELRAGPTVSVRVFDSEGVPVAGAQVDQYGLTPAQAHRGGDGRTLERARRLVVDRNQADTNGIVECARYPGEVVLVASDGARASIPWRGEPRALITLVLGATFTVGGTLALPDWSHLKYEGERRILVEVENGGESQSLACLRQVVAGPWGPVRLPHASSGRYILELEGSPVIPTWLAFSAPPPGGHLDFHLSPELGHPLSLRVEDESGRGLPDAEVASYWFEGGSERVLRRRGDSDGYIDNWSFPSGALVKSFVSAPGHAGRWADEVRFPEASPRTHRVVLKPSATLFGKCVHGGEPVRDFEIVVWEPSRSSFTQVRRAFRGAADGEFEFPDAPGGLVAVSAVTGTLPFTRPVHVTLPSSERVLLELDSPLPGSGQVVDLETGTSLSSAIVQALAISAEGALRPWGRAHAVDEEGRFEFDGFLAGQNAVRVVAEGFAEREVRAFLRDGRVDFGRIAMDRPRVLDLSVFADGPFDFTRITVSGAEGTPVQKRAFGMDGKARLEGIPPGTRFVELEGSPQATWVSLRLNLEPGRRWNFAHKVAGNWPLTIEVTGDSEDLPSIVGLSVSYESRSGVHTELGLPLRLGSPIKIDGVDADSAFVNVMGPVTVRSGTLAELQGDELVARLELGGAPFPLRVVDSSGEPIPAVLVRVTDSQPTALYLVGTTDADGVCLFSGLPRRPIRVSLEHETRGRLFGVPIDGGADGAEVTLETHAGLHLVVQDEDTPISGVTARILVTAIGSRWNVLGQSDGTGQIRAEGLGEGAYEVNLEHPDCWPVTREARARREPAPERVQLRRRGALELLLLTRDGDPIQGVGVDLHSLEFAEDVHAWIEEERVSSNTGLVSDSQGRIRVERLPRGPYRYRLRVEDSEPIDGRCEVPAGALLRLPIIVP